MPNRATKKKTKKEEQSNMPLNDEKIPEISMGELLKDNRESVIAGIFCIVLCIFFFFAFTSYLFTWQEDQDKIQNYGIKIFTVDDVKIYNMLGVLGAYMANIFVYNGFGLASFLLCAFLFVLGFNLIFDKKIFSLARNAKYILVGLLVLSVALSFFSGKTASFPFGGQVGNIITAWMTKWIGSVGTGIALTFAVLSYLVWRFNPTLKWPIFQTKAANIPTQNPESASNAEATATVEKHTETDIQESKPNQLKSDSETEIAFPEKTNEDNLGLEIIEMPAEDEIPTLHIDNKVDQEHAETAQAFQVEPGFDMEEMPTYPQSNVHITPLPVTPATPELSLEIHPSVEDAPAPHQEVESTINAPVEEKMAITEQHGEYDPHLDLANYKYPTLDMLETYANTRTVQDPAELEENKNQIISTLKNYDISIQRISATVGPTVTLYEIVPAPGVRISRIKNLEDDIALSLSALGIRIIAPIPGKGTIGIEVPNINKSIVSMYSMLASEKFQNSKFSLPIAIGKKINNENFIVDLASMPHLLMAGATGQGKSVGLNAILISLLYKKHPSELKFVLVDPKKVELSIYRMIEKHFLAKLPGEEEAIITDTKKVIATLNALCIEMDNRYDLLKEAGCRNIKEYNEKFKQRRLNPQKGHQFLPFIVLVIDEFADLIMTAGKEVETPIARLAQLARAIGIHLIIATQRPSVNIITGTIKANFPARIAFKVSSKIDSRTILDVGGAEQLIGKGDMLINYNGDLTRLQCAFVDTPEVDRICEFIGDQQGYPDAFLLPEYVDEKELESKDANDLSDRDSMFEDAARLIVTNQMGSTSMLQRRLKLGYNRAGRLMDQLEMAGVVGPNLGSKVRDVLIKTEPELQVLLDNLP